MARAAVERAIFGFNVGLVASRLGHVFAGESLGKVCIECTDTPGFVVNRLLVPYVARAVARSRGSHDLTAFSTSRSYLGTAIEMLERGVASAEDIDKGMMYGAGHPMGPIHLADYVGLDICYNGAVPTSPPRLAPALTATISSSAEWLGAQERDPRTGDQRA